MSRTRSRLTTAGSASTWPKSGFTVAVSVNAGVIAYFMSRPTDAPGSTTLDERVAAVGLRRQVADGIGHELEALGRLGQLQAAELAELRNEAVGALGDERPGRRFVQPGNLPRQRESERARRTPGTEAATTECGTRRSSRRRAWRRPRPRRRPSPGLVAVVEVVLVLLHARRVHRELVHRPLVVVRVDHDSDPVRWRLRVAAREESRDLLRLWIERQDRDVEVLRVVGHARFGRVGRRRTFFGSRCTNPSIFGALDQTSSVNSPSSLSAVASLTGTASTTGAAPSTGRPFGAPGGSSLRVDRASTGRAVRVQTASRKSSRAFFMNAVLDDSRGC